MGRVDQPHLLGRERAHIVRYPAGASLGRRTLRDHELVLLLSGSAVWTTDGVPRALQPGSVLLAVPGTTDAYDWDPHEPTRHAFVHFSLAGEPTAEPVVHHQPHTGVIGMLFRYLVWLDSQSGEDSRLLAEQTFGLLLGAVLTGRTPELARQDELPAAVRACVEHVRELWADGILRPVAVDRLAAEAGVSIRGLARAFGATLGLPPAHALEAVRLARAAALVRSGRLPLREIADACGFSDAFHLSRRIRNAYGVPPAVLREAEHTHDVVDPFPPGVRRLEQLLFELPGVDDLAPWIPEGSAGTGPQPTVQPPSTTID